MLENADHSNTGLCTVRQAVHARVVETYRFVTAEGAGKTAEGSLDGVMSHPAPGTHNHGADKLRNQARIALPQE